MLLLLFVAGLIVWKSTAHRIVLEKTQIYVWYIFAFHPRITEKGNVFTNKPK